MQYFNRHSADGGGQPTQPAGWGDWIFWQYNGDKLSINGIHQDAAKTRPVFVDMNVDRHSLEELYRLAKADPSKFKSDPAPIQPSAPAPAPVQPQPVINPQPESIPATYIIQSADTFWAISIKSGITVEDIVRLNNIVNPGLVFAGQVFQIPGNRLRHKHALEHLTIKTLRVFETLRVYLFEAPACAV